MGRTKYNVDKDTAARTLDGIVFASGLEMRYYRDVVKPQLESGLIKNFELQKRYELQPKFIKNDKVVRPIVYVADFFIEYADGTCVVIDTKGCPDATALLKKKFFWYKYPDIPYQWITYVKKWGGWIDYEEAKKRRRDAKRTKELKEDKQNGTC